MDIDEGPNGAVPKGKTVLITGGAGFLGSWLCDHYLARSDRVICVDNLSTGRIKNIEQFLDSGNF
ncbi:MAG: NAD-dependent epimerase/dehydratase family protein, partial [Paracoccaceae bacterium]|nr:NAD-dependent epimerase/dehydratase family protein [Paracoccaceae bacterium]